MGPGQEIDMRPSKRYMDVMNDVEQWIDDYLKGKLQPCQG